MAYHGRSFVLVALVDVRDRRLTTAIVIGIRLSPYFMFGGSVERDGDSEGVRVALSM